MSEVRPATPADLPRVGAVLAAAFADDPVWAWLASPRAEWTSRAAAWFEREAALQVAGHGSVLVDAAVRGAAIWAPPRRWKSSAAESRSLLVPSLRLFGRNSLRGLRLLSKIESSHPRDPEHWYLAILGTDPAHQGHGVGSALVSEITRRCDAEGLGAYLESSKEDNLAFYRRHGFEVREELRAPGVPSLWTMWREPREDRP